MQATRDRWGWLGAAAGAAAVGLYLLGAAVMPREPDFGASAGEVAAFFDQNRTQIQIGCAIQALWAPLFVWFLAVVQSRAQSAGERPARAAAVAFGCGLIFITLFMADVGSLAVAALRPGNLLETPELAASLRDFSWLAMAMAAPAVCAMAIAIGVISLRDGALWPRWVGWFSLVTAFAYSLRIGTLFTTDGAFAADGLLGLWVPVLSIASWLVVCSAVLAMRRKGVIPAPSESDARAVV